MRCDGWRTAGRFTFYKDTCHSIELMSDRLEVTREPVCACTTQRSVRSANRWARSLWPFRDTPPTSTPIVAWLCEHYDEGADADRPSNGC